MTDFFLTAAAWAAFGATFYTFLFCLRKNPRVRPIAGYFLVMSAALGLMVYSYMGLFAGTRTIEQHMQLARVVGPLTFTHIVLMTYLWVRKEDD